MNEPGSFSVMQKTINWAGLVLVLYMLSALVLRPLGGGVIAPSVGVALAVFGLLYCSFGKQLSLAIWISLGSIVSFLILVWIDVIFQQPNELRFAAALSYQVFVLVFAACLGRYLSYAAVKGIVLAALIVYGIGLIVSTSLSEFRYSTIYGEAINQMGGLMAIGFGLSIWLADYNARRARLRAARIAFVCSALLLVGALLSGSRQAIVLTLPWLIVALALGRIYWIAFMSAFLIVILKVWIRVFEIDLYIFKRVQGILAVFGWAEPTGERSIDTRVTLLNEAIAGWREAPFMGKGIRAFEKVGGYEMYTHNNYLELLYNHGLVGFGTFYLPISIALSSAVITVGRRQIGREGAALVIGCCLFILIQGVFIVNYHHYLTWCILVIIISVWANSWIVPGKGSKCIR